jgi:hypothetical protein
MTDRVYIPNLKTSDSELRALRYLAPEVRARILPAFELTRSRITKKEPKGSIYRRAEQLLEISGMSRFIVDITTEADLMNDEMNKFFDEANGYASWRSFLSVAFGPEIIPALLFVDGGSQAEFKRQVEKLLSSYDTVAIRTSVSEPEAKQLYDWALEVAPSNRIIVIGSVYFLEQGLLKLYVDRCRTFATDVVGNQYPQSIAFPGSSFPKAVGSGDYGEDDAGEFTALELPLFSQLKAALPNAPLIYSDYAAVHPIRYPTKGGSWIPRIDVFDGGKFYFSRLRAPDGGYSTAAKIIASGHAKNLPACWGTDQVVQASTGSLPGRSPSFWISARINMWITDRALKLR